MNSFLAYLNKAKQSLADTVTQVSGAAKDPALFGQLIVNYWVPIVLFFALSPGIILNLPFTSKERCKKLVPSPATSTGSCSFDTGVYTLGTADTVTVPQMLPICQALKKCRSVFMSEYTSWYAALLHGLVFLIVFQLIKTFALKK